MTDPARHSFFHRRGLGLVVGTVVVVAAGAASLDENRARFLQTSLVARRDLADALRRFDHDLSDDRQQAIKALDDRLNTLSPDDRAAYLAVMRTFHNWLDTLSDRARDDLLAKAPEERLAAIKSLVAKYPLPSVEARSPVDFILTGETGVFELASLCKSWLTLSPQVRQKLDAAPEVGRRAELHRLGRVEGVPFELIPADFDEKEWIDRVENQLKEIRDDGTGTARKDWVAKLQTRISEVAARRKANGRGLRHPLLHHLAVNLYVQEHSPLPKVDPSRLAAFFEAIPSWVQSTFNGFPSDEARRRLTLVYRLIYPAPQEFDPRAVTKKPAPAASAAAKAPAPRPTAGPPTPPALPPAKSSKSAAPF